MFSDKTHEWSNYPPIRNKEEFVPFMEKYCYSKPDALPVEEFNLWHDRGVLWFHTDTDPIYTRFEYSEDGSERLVIWEDDEDDGNEEEEAPEDRDFYKVCVDPEGLFASCFEDGANWILDCVCGWNCKSFVGQNTCHIGNNMYWIIEKCNFNLIIALRFDYETYKQKVREAIEALYEYKKAGEPTYCETDGKYDPGLGSSLNDWYPNLERLEEMLRALTSGHIEKEND